MAIRKKGSRRIVVDGVEYRWRIAPLPTRSEEDYACAMTASVQRAENAGQVLFVLCGLRAGNILGRPGAVVTPRQIAAAIRNALATGWKPDQSGEPFRTKLPSADES
jgi:hypothetical protein